MDSSKSNALCFKRFIKEVDSQATASAKLPLPEGRTASKPLFFTGDVRISDAHCGENSVLSEGEIALTAVCTDSDGTLYSFTSKAPFSHETEADGVRPNMSVRVSASLIGLDVDVPSPDTLFANATISFLFTVEDAMPLYTADLDKLNTPCETHITSLEYTDRQSVYRSRPRVREEIAFPEIDAAVYSTASAFIRELKYTETELLAECLLNIDALCRKRNGEYVHLTQSVPVTISEETDALQDTDGVLSGKVSVTDVEIRALGEEFGILSLEALFSLDIYSQKRQITSFPDDAYTPQKNKTLVLEKTASKALLFNGERDIKSVFFEDIKLESQPSKIIYTAVRPVITSAAKNNNGAELQGIAELTVIYQTESGAVLSASEERAFSISTDLTCDNIEAYIVHANASASVLSQGASITYTVTVRADEYSEVTVSPIISVKAEDKKCVGKRSGFTVYFAGEGESIFDIGKRYSSAVSAIYAQNPELQDKKVLSDGERVILFS